MREVWDRGIRVVGYSNNIRQEAQETGV